MFCTYIITQHTGRFKITYKGDELLVIPEYPYIDILNITTYTL